MNHYQTLGLSPDASHSDVKKAYRKLASKHHPDKGGDAEQFKRISEAYEQITNPSPDPHAYREQTSYTRDQFEEMFGQGDPLNGFFRQGPRRNPDVVTNINISLLQSYTGDDFLLDLGFAKEMLQLQPGIRDQTKLRVPNKGHQRFSQLPPGDLIVRVSVVCPAGIARDNDDLYQRVKINSIDAILGCNIELNHISGKKLNIKVPKHTQPGSKLRLTGWGMPNPVNQKKGNFYAIVEIVTPAITNEKHIEMLNIIKQEAIQ